MRIRCKKRPRRPGKSQCERCFEYQANWRRKQTDNAQKPGQTMSEVDQESDEEESFPEDLQDSEEQDHLETDPDDDDLVDEIVSGSGINRMAIDFIVN